MCKKRTIKKIFGGGGSPKVQQVIVPPTPAPTPAPAVLPAPAPAPAPSAVSVNAPSSNPEGSMGFQDNGVNENNENTFKRKGKNALKIIKKNLSMQGLQI